MYSQRRKNIIVELIDDFRKFFFWNSQYLVKPGIENLFQRVSRILTFVHQVCSADEGAQQDFWCDVSSHMLAKCLEICWNKSIKICIDQGVIKVEQQS